MKINAGDISVKQVRRFLSTLGYDWHFLYWKKDMQTFSVAENFEDIDCLNGNKMVLELFQHKKIYYYWFVITESIFKRIVSQSHSMSCEIAEDFSEAWQNFLNNNFSLTN